MLCYTTLLGESVRKPIDEATSLRDLHSNAHAVFGLFLFSGYLTLGKKPIFEDDALQCELRIPNQEIRHLYRAGIAEWLEKSLPDQCLPSLLESLTEGNVNIFAEHLQTLVIKSMSFYDIIEDEPERVYHAFILGLLVALEKTHEVKSNRESGFGRYDVCVIPKNRSLLGIVIEFKKAKTEKELKDSALDALKQIEKQNYVAEMQALEIKNLLLLGIAFHGKRLFIEKNLILE